MNKLLSFAFEFFNFFFELFYVLGKVVDSFEQLLRGSVINYSFALYAHNFSRNTHNSAVLGHVVENDGVCRNFCVVAYLDRSEYFCAAYDRYVVSECGMTFAVILTRAAQCYALKQCAVIAYFGCLAYYDAGAVVYEKAFAYFCTGVYLDTRKKSA